MKNTKHICAIVFYVLFLIAGNNKSQAQLAIPPAKKTVPALSKEEVAKLRSAVESNPNDLAMHEAYLKGVGIADPDFEKQYELWMKQFPNTATVPYAIGHQFAMHENAKAKPWLLKALAIDPKLLDAYRDLSIDAERWGDFEGSRGYLKKATEVSPENADFAMKYAFSLDRVDSVLHHKLMLSIHERFPSSPRGAQALYWLAFKTHDPKVKAELYELLKKKFNTEKSVWTSISMDDYYDLLLETNPVKAFGLAKSILAMDSLEDRSNWEKRQQIAKAIVSARELTKAGKFKEATTMLEKTSAIRRSASEMVLPLEKARAIFLSGEKKQAYDTVLHQYAWNPADNVMKTIKEYGEEIGKNDKIIQQEIWAIRRTKAEPATVFSLDNYLSSGKTSLNDLKGKVVLITYWFPGCGPCRNEFPHFENVVRKFGKDQLAYVGINMVHEQDPYVVSFLKKSGYSFTPVRDDPDKRGNLTARGAPTNYLLDKDGNIVFKNFLIHGYNERMLELMITELLGK